MTAIVHRRGRTTTVTVDCGRSSALGMSVDTLDDDLVLRNSAT
ncbi:MAG TPA: hypothetical protein VH210_02430 [Gaiellaceae bacterium]|nr:hypothetical protein [Gaiellaceae bacterium]